MTLQWTFVATCLYIEVFIVAVLLLPFISPHRWQKVFRSRILATFQSYGKTFFKIFIAILLLFLFESVRVVHKYSEPMSIEELKHHPQAEDLFHMKLFRAQRNFYIAGFALFLCFIIGRLVVLLTTRATLMAECEAVQRQAHSATTAAEQLLSERDDNYRNDSREDNARAGGDSAHSQLSVTLQKTHEQLEKTKEELVHARLYFESMKKRAQSVSSEYDQLLEEHSKLQKKLSFLEGLAERSESKKDN